MKKHKASKGDKYSTNVDATAAEAVASKKLEGPRVEGVEDDGEKLSDHELDMHHDCLMKAEAVKGNPNIMKQLGPHMEKKMGHMQKITSIAGLKAKAKAMEG